MASLSSPGIGSNLDVKTIVSQLMTIESQPLTLLATKEASYTAKLTSYGLVKGALSSLQAAAQTLNLSTTYTAVTPSVSDSSILSAAVNGSTPAGTYSIEVDQLAQAQKLTSGDYAGTDTVVGDGTLTLNFGTYSDAGSPPVTFTANPDNTTTTITIDSSNHTLAGIRDAINGSGAPVTATIINDGTGYRLSLTSKNTGADNALQIGVTESGAAGLAQLAYDGSAGGVSNLTQNVAPADAQIKVDGIAISSSSNTVTDAVQGVTLTLAKTTASGSPTTLTLSRDTSKITTALQSFVTAYNNVNTQITSATKYDSTTGKASTLTGDSTMLSIETQLRNAISNPITGAPAGLSTLSDIGISFQLDGTLSLDTDKLNKVLADPSKDISTLFTKNSTTGVEGYGSRVNSLVSGMIFGSDALVNGRIDGLTASIKDIDKQRDEENVRLTSIEARYTAQFSALDTLIGSMNTTSSYLTQQLAALQSSTKG